MEEKKIINIDENSSAADIQIACEVLAGIPNGNMQIVMTTAEDDEPVRNIVSNEFAIVIKGDAQFLKISDDYLVRKSEMERALINCDRIDGVSEVGPREDF